MTKPRGLGEALQSSRSQSAPRQGQPALGTAIVSGETSFVKHARQKSVPVNGALCCRFGSSFRPRLCANWSSVSVYPDARMRWAKPGEGRLIALCAPAVVAVHHEVRCIHHPLRSGDEERSTPSAAVCPGCRSSGSMRFTLRRDHQRALYLPDCSGPVAGSGVATGAPANQSRGRRILALRQAGQPKGKVDVSK